MVDDKGSPDKCVGIFDRGTRGLKISNNKEPWNFEGKKKVILSLLKETRMPGLSRYNVCDG